MRMRSHEDYVEHALRLTNVFCAFYLVWLGFVGVSTVVRRMEPSQDRVSNMKHLY